MTDLIARIESAEAGSRELSDEVLLALWGHPLSANVKSRPSPTESVDDALGLVPEGLNALIASDGEAMFFTHRYAEDGDWLGMTEPIYAATPALALCAAVLRYCDAR